MSAQRIVLVKEAALASIPGLQKFAMQATRRVVRLQERRRKLRRDLKAVDDELRLAKQQLRAVMHKALSDDVLDTPMPEADAPADVAS